MLELWPVGNAESMSDIATGHCLIKIYKLWPVLSTVLTRTGHRLHTSNVFGFELLTFQTN